MFKFFIFSILLLPYFLYSQEYPIKIFTTNDGLSQMQVLTVFKDSRGYIWAGTKYGISKYNGEKFTRYRPIQGILGVEVYSFAEDNKGNLYIGSSDGLCKFDGKIFTKIKSHQIGVNGLARDSKNNIYTIIKNEIFQVNKADSLVKLDWPILKNKKIETIYYDKKRKENIITIRNVGVGILKKDGIKIILPVSKILELSEKGEKVSAEMFNYEYLVTSNGDATIRVTLGAKSKFYFISNQNILTPLINTDLNKIEILSKLPYDYPFFSDGQMFLLKANSFQFQLIDKNIIMGAVWPAYVRNGFFVPTEQGLAQVITNGFMYFKKEDVPYCWAVSEDKYQRNWLWNYGFPINIWDEKKLSKVENILPIINKINNRNFPERKEILDNHWYFGSLKDKYGNLWQSHPSGVLHYDYKKFSFIQNPKLEHRLSFSLLEDSVQNVVLSGSQKSVHIFENKPPFKSKTLTSKDGMNIGYYVLCMALETPGVYWFGGGNGITRYNSTNKTWNEFTLNNGRNKYRYILDMKFDNRKTLWVASGENGLFYLDKKADSLIAIPSPALNEPIAYIGQMDENHLMIGSVREIYILNLEKWYKNKTIELKTFNNHNGYMGLEAGQHGFFKDSKGLIWAASSTILSVIDPKKLNLNSDSLHTYFTKFNREPVPFNIDSEAYSSDGDVRIEFESVGENKSVESQYAYKLDGATEWSPWQMEPVATFSKLASGNYTLCVKSRTGNGDDSFTTAATIKFSVKVLLWESPYFPIYVLMSLMALGGFLFWYFNKQNKRALVNKQDLAQKEQLLLQKVIEAKQQDIQVQSLQVQTAQAQMNPHFTFNVLNSITGLIRNNDIENANSNLVKLSKLVRSYLDSSVKQGISAFEPEKTKIALDKEIELLQLYIDLEKLKNNNAFDAIIEVAPEIGTDFYKIYPLIIQPYVENAIIHGVIPDKTKRGFIEVRFTTDEEETLICQIIDNGIGREASAKFKTNQTTMHISHGTDLVNKRISILNEMGVKITIETIDNEPTGTIVTIKQYI